ncbi:MAG: hypothetical protein V3T86_05375 [Planctomycetota bacterium]
MRVLGLLAALCAPLFAQDAPSRFQTAMQVFRAERETAFQSGAAARVHAALDMLLETKDARAAEPLASFLAEAIRQEPRVRKRIMKVEQEGFSSHKRHTELEEELKLLRMQEEAGAAVGPEIVKLEEEQRKHLDEFQRVQGEVRDQISLGEHAREVRERVATGLIEILSIQKTHKTAAASIGALRRNLDVTSRVESLVLVRVLRESRLREAIPALVEIFEQPRTSPPAVRAALAATASLVAIYGDADGAEALVRVWERDPEGTGVALGPRLSVAARRRIPDPAAARKWIEELRAKAAKAAKEDAGSKEPGGTKREDVPDDSNKAERSATDGSK